MLNIVRLWKTLKSHAGFIGIIQSNYAMIARDKLNEMVNDKIKGKHKKKMEISSS